MAICIALSLGHFGPKSHGWISQSGLGEATGWRGFEPCQHEMNRRIEYK